MKTHPSLGRGLISSCPKPYRCESYGCEKCDGEFLEACGDAAEVFELVEVSLNEIALPVDRAIHGTLNLAVALGGNMRLCAARSDGNPPEN